MKKRIRVSAMLMLLFAGGCTQFPNAPVATAQTYDPVDSFQQYAQRSEKITLSAGNAQEVNARIQEVDPWPRNVGNSRIAVDGQPMADAVWRYRCGKPAPPPLAIQSTSSATSGGGAAVTTSSGTVRPDSDCGSGAFQGSVNVGSGATQ